MHKRWWAILAAIVALAIVGGGLRWGLWDSPPTPTLPPEVASEDPELAEAINRARSRVTARPEDATEWGRLGQTLLANGLSDPARICFSRAQELDATEPRWAYLEGVSLLLRDPMAAIPCWQHAAERARGDELALTARLRWAEALMANDRLVEADEILRQELVTHPENVRLHFDLGSLASARSDSAGAIDQFRRCGNDPACRRKAATNLAALLSLQGKSDEAASFAAQAERLPPDSDWPDPFLSEIALMTLGRDGLFIQAEKQQQMGNVGLAEQMFYEVIQRYPDEARAYAKLGMILTERGDYARAEGTLRDGLRRSPDHVQCLFLLAAALFHQAERRGFDREESQAKLREAAASAARAVELKPDHGFAHLYRGLALKHLGQQREALASMREAARCTPEATDPHLHLGQALWEAGQVDEGRRELETAIRLAGPADKRPQATLDRLRSGGPAPKSPK
jgi:tetratricopeptide (TPR) repeat protein